MKVLSRSIIIFLILVFFFSKSSLSQPLIVIHVTGGYSLPTGDLNGSILDTISSYYQTKHGFNIGADAKLGLGKTRDLRLVFSVQYHGFYNKTDNVVNNSVGYESIKFSATELGLGVEYALNSKGMLDPFIGLDLTSSFYGGSRTFDNPDNDHTNASLNSATRLGIVLGAGLDFMLFKNSGLGFVIGAKYHASNMLGKKSGNNVYINTNYDLIDNSKNLSFVSLYAGVTFNIGNPVKSRR